MPRVSSREKILDAAEAVVLEVGAGHMTLDAVAKKAGLSKGGLIYNFPSKDSLLQAMVLRYVERLSLTRAKQRVGRPDDPAREIKAYISSVLNRSKKDTRIGAALLAAAAHDPQLLFSARAPYRRMLDELTGTTFRPESIAIISLATECLWLSELVGINFFTAEEREAVVNELLRLAET